MTPGASAATKLIRENLPEFGTDIYSNIPSGELVVFAVQFLQDDNVPATVEEVVSACFRFFPHSFSLKNYFFWPDSALVARHLSNAKEKGYIKGNPVDGYALKVLGRQVAKRVAKSLGLPLPMPQKVKKTWPGGKKPKPAKPSKTQARKKSTGKTQKSIAPVKEEKSPKKQSTVKNKSFPKKTPPKQAKPEKVSVQLSPLQTKQKTASKPKQKKLEKGKKKLSTPAPQKEKRRALKPKVAKQLHLLIPTAAKEEIKPAHVRPKKPAKKTAAKIHVKSRNAKTEKIVNIEKDSTSTAPISVSKEEKAKAGKVLHMMGRSDAYQRYKKQGRKANISEFDFRNMLFATMESSAETLKRNLALFKRYAGIHNRQDLTTFLNICEENFASLLKPSGRKSYKKR